jgi:hypothetical protein
VQRLAVEGTCEQEDQIEATGPLGRAEFRS